jgi:ABC-type polysaccharide/polyol phosphate export permease
MTSGFFWIVGRTFLSKLVQRRALLGNLVVRDFQQRYVGSAVGWLWGAVQPAVLLLSYTFVFSKVFQIKPLPGSGTDSFVLSLFAGILPWLLFQDTVQRSVTSVVDYSNLITKTMFPSEVLPLALFLSGLINHAFGLVVLLAICVYLKKLTLLVLLLPVYLLLLGLFTVGFSWLMSSLHVFLRDTAHALSIVLIFWFWFTPIFYQREQLPARVRFLATLNPLAYVVDAYRKCTLAGRAPALADLAILALFSVGVFIAGGMFFRYTKRAFGDVL